MQRRFATIDVDEQLLQLRPNARAGGQQASPAAHIPRDVMFDRQQAVGVAVQLALADGQQFARFSVEDEDEPVEQDEGVVIDRLQRLRLRLQALGA